MAILQLRAIVLVVLFSFTSADTEFFVSPSLGTDELGCGESPSAPCSSLLFTLSLTSTVVPYDETLGESNSLECYSTNTTDGITIVLLEGVHVVDPVCFKSVTNLVFIGRGVLSSIRSSILGNTYGVFAFFDSQEVTIDNITFIDSVTGRSLIYAQNTTDFHIRHCNIPVYANGATGIWIVNPYGAVTISHVQFHGNLVLAKQFTPGPALLLTIGASYSSVGLLGQSSADITAPSDILVQNCTFEKITSDDVYTTNTDNYRSSSTRSKVIQVLLRSGAADNRITFVNCFFLGNVDTVGSIALVRIGDDSSSNSIEFQECTYESNTARFGGGIAVYFVENAEDNNVTIANSVFLNNKATLEGGGVFMATLAQNPQSNFLHVRNSFFFANSASYGAGVFLFNDPTLYSSSPGLFVTSPPIMDIRITDSEFNSNNAPLAEGVVNTLRIQLEMNGKNILTSNIGSAIVLRSSNIVLTDEAVFSHNKANKGAALKILDGSLVDMYGLTTGNFTFNQAMYSGGALYADESSTTITADQYNHTNAQVALGSCFIQMPTSFDNPEAVVYLSNNTAITAGNDFYIYCVRSCFQNYFLPEPFNQYTLNIYGNPVVIETDNPLAVLSTGPTYIFFYGASTKCYKPVGELVYLLPNCSHELLMENFEGLSQLSCGVDSTIVELGESFVPGRGMFHPLVDQLILPWASIGNSWMVEPGKRRQTCLETNPASLILSPAPGEKFDLTVQLGDQLLNTASGTVFLEIDHPSGVSPQVLIQLNGIQWAYDDRVYFTPNRALSDIALVGLPGTSGHINVVSESQILGLDIVLQIPFQLSQCPLGYYDPPMTGSSLQEIDELIVQNYSSTQRIPEEQPLACQCFVDSTVKFRDTKDYSSKCIGGYTVNLNGILWAGLIPLRNATKLHELPTTDCYDSFSNETYQSDSLTVLISDARVKQLQLLGSSQDPDTSPIDVVPYEGGVTPGGGAPVKCYTNYTIDELVQFRVNGEFSVDLCTRGFCLGSEETNWYLSDIDYPCTDNRQGVLCGQCKPGLSLTLTTTKCQDCSNPRWYIPLITTLSLGLLLLIFVVAFNIGVSPTVDSFLFFIQAVYVIVSGRLDYRDFEILSFFNLDFTFNQCIISDLQALQRLLLQYVTPFYILVLLVFLLLLTKTKGFSKYFGKHSCLNALWLLVLISYLNIANSTFEILNCQKIGPGNKGFTEDVLVYDASVVCWTGLHLPFAIMAVLLATFLIVPFPIYTAIAIKIPKLKPITDVYCGLYRDEQRYWIIWNLLRRVLIVMVSVFVPNFISRHLFLLLLSIFILVVSVSTWPYKYWLDNAYSTFVLIVLVVFCVVTQPEVYVLADPQRIVSWTLVAIVCSSTLVLISIEVSLWYMSRKGLKFSKDSLTPSKGKTWVHKWIENAKRNFRQPGSFSELEESVHSNEYYERESAYRYKQFREPLIDSINFSSLRVSNKLTNSSNESSTPSQDVTVDEPGINSLHQSPPVTHSIITRDFKK